MIFDEMVNNKSNKRISFVLTGGYAIGGAETRFVNAFKHLQNNSNGFEYFLFVSGKRFAAFYNHKLLSSTEKNIIINCPKFYVELLKKRYVKSFLHNSNKNNRFPLSSIRKLINRFLRWFYFFYNTLFVITYIHLKKINIIHPITEGSPPCGIVKIIKPKIKMVSTYLSLKPSYHKKGFYYLYSSQYLSLKKADMIDVLGKSYLEALKKTKVPINENKLSITRCSFVKPFEVSKTKYKTVVFSGRLIEQKNPLLFVEAAKLVIDSGLHDITFLILGSGPLKSNIENRIKSYNLENLVKTYYCFDQTEVLSKSLIFCSLQAVDNYPSQSLLQAMYAQNGIVATNFGETNKLIKHGETGLLVEQNPEDISKHILFYLNNPEKLKRMGQKASKLVSKEHNIKRFSKYLNSIYAKLTN